MRRFGKRYFGENGSKCSRFIVGLFFISTIFCTAYFEEYCFRHDHGLSDVPNLHAWYKSSSSNTPSLREFIANGHAILGGTRHIPSDSPRSARESKTAKRERKQKRKQEKKRRKQHKQLGRQKKTLLSYQNKYKEKLLIGIIA